MLTYEGADTSALMPYFSHRFRPLQPLQVFGRDAKADPPCPPSHAVWYAWKDYELSAFFVEGWESSHAPFCVLWALLAGICDWLADLAGRLAGHVARACLMQVQRVLSLTISDLRNGSGSDWACHVRACSL